MSTKTSIKRIAAVAALALTLGGFSAVSASAVALQKITLGSVAGVQTTTGTTGVAVTTLVNFNGYCTYDGDKAVYQAVYTALQATSKVGMPALTNLAYTDNTYSQLSSWYQAGNGNAPYSYFIQKGFVEGSNAGSTFEVEQNCRQSGRYNVYATLSFTPDVAGTYSILVQDPQAAYTQTTWTVVVTAPDNKADAVKTTSFLNAGETTTATADATVTASMALSDTATATIVVTPKNAAGTAIAPTALTVSVSGPGTVAVGANLAAITALSAGTGRAVTGAAGSYVVGVFADGTAGVSTITISSGTTELSKETVTFYGAAAKITPTVVNSVLKIGANTGAVTAIVTDALGTPVAGTRVYAVSGTDATIDDAYVASTAVSTATGSVSFDLTGVAAGTAAITLTLNSASTGTSTVSAVAGTMRVSDGVVTKVDYAFDKESYAPGETAKITATVSNAAGVMPAGEYTVLATGGVTANYAVTGLPTTTVLAVASTGKATYTVVIPVGISGDLQLIGTASATTIAATFGKAAVVNAALDAATAATDAATEAYDAATAATDAANEAAAAADAATAAAQDAADAVAALSVQVTEQIAELKAQNAALRKQITALTNLIIKIQKKVKA